MVLLHGEEPGFIGQWSAANRINQVIGIFQFLLHLCSQLCQLKCLTMYHYDLYNLGVFYARVCVRTCVCMCVCVCVCVCMCVTSFGNMKPFCDHIMACRVFGTLLWLSWLSHNYGPAKLFQPSRVPMHS